MSFKFFYIFYKIDYRQFGLLFEVNMENLKEVKEIKIKRPAKAELSKEEVIKRMESVEERKEKLLAIARKSQNGSLSS